MAFLGPFNAAAINPSLVLLSKAMDVSSKTAAYSTTTCIIIGGLSNPCTNVYGRRPIALLSMLTTVIGGIDSACSPNFATLVGTRAICGVEMGGMMSVGTAVVNDMFFLHERGEKTGIYSIFVTNGAHIAAIIGGYTGQAGGWQWNYWVGAIITGIALLFAIFFFPETLFRRDAVALVTKRHE
ncbi:hypothetical protein BPOR_0863g00010 [Botrytis porri]|uniref:Major facilitator superfamily (MFS) profile domain-containing protein n=1 Tax=Botrytis porri TaxID=87229 RepID=A0A4Z1KA81_9HELO|nr:hypothetical protein BPOR_0863g00010 [Botrytis porri]